MISGFRAAFAVLILALTTAAVLTGCGDTFRPTIQVQPTPGGDSASGLSQAIIVSTNPAGNGFNEHINVSGDTNVGQVQLGLNPLFLGKGGGRAFVINSNNTATLYTALLPQSAAINAVTLPASTSGAIGGGFSSNGNIYIANSGTNDVSVIPGSQVAVTQVVPVGAGPVMVIGSPNSSKVYSVDRNGNDVTVISTIDNTFVKTITVGSQPIWGVMSSDGNQVYVVNQGSGTVSVIDTVLDTVITTIPVGASPNFAYFENNLKRVYVSNTGSSTVSVIKGDNINLATGSLPIKLADISLSGAPVSVTALSDGTRAYAALGACPAGTNHTTIAGLAGGGSCTGNRVSVIDVVGFRESKIITVGAGVVSVDASSDASRVYAANSIDKNISVIKTSSDTELVRMAAPSQSLSCSNPLACPNTGQTPFEVRTFP